MNTTVLIKKISPLLGKEIPLPFYATPGAAAMDLHACMEEDIVLLPGARAMVPLGFCMALEDSGLAAFLFARSGLATKHGIALANSVGVVDSDYRGEVKVGLYNSSGEAFVIKPGERVAQMAFLPVLTAQLVLSDHLPDSVRGEGGFGSTGK